MIEFNSPTCSDNMAYRARRRTGCIRNARLTVKESSWVLGKLCSLGFDEEANRSVYFAHVGLRAYKARRQMRDT